MSSVHVNEANPLAIDVQSTHVDDPGIASRSGRPARVGPLQIHIYVITIRGRGKR
jgi:hypothetical protein